MFQVYNTLTRRVEPFDPIEKGHVRMYTCGPTVYDHAHIGNFRAYVFEDVLRRRLKHCGYSVTQAMNLTDVDDKTIKGARAAGIALGDYTRKYKAAFFEDLKALNIERAEHYPAATEHVTEMIGLIRRLFDGGYAYKSDDGSVYFRISMFRGYGKLARLDTQGLKAGARVSQDEYEKEDVADFALWKAWGEDDGEAAWDSPWGRGRPGWHIECSAMSMKYLGETFDLHTGGVDNIFPHHEDEIAQSEAATGKQFVRYWMHCAHLVVDGRKMSKSLGNFYTLRDILAKGYNGREVRYALISGHYRQQLNFTFEALDGARAALSRLDEFRGRLEEKSGGLSTPDWKQGLPEWAAAGSRRFWEAIDDDLNTAEALGALFDVVRDGNKALDGGSAGRGQCAAALGFLKDIDVVLGVVERSEQKADGAALALLEEREKERADRRWDDADRIRKRLADLGWVVQDTPSGPKLKRAPGARSG